jgi:hypothetical protein
VNGLAIADLSLRLTLRLMKYTEQERTHLENTWPLYIFFISLNRVFDVATLRAKFNIGKGANDETEVKYLHMEHSIRVDQNQCIRSD